MLTDVRFPWYRVERQRNGDKNVCLSEKIHYRRRTLLCAGMRYHEFMLFKCGLSR